MNKKYIRDLLVRFILHLPHCELQCSNRVMYHLQLAYWFYLDFYLCIDGDQFLPFKVFCLIVGTYCGWDRKLVLCNYHSYISYQKSTLRCGVVLFSTDCRNVVLVRSYLGKWSFPKGKINQNESYATCAAREVFEEINYNVKVFDLAGVCYYKVIDCGYCCMFFPVWNVPVTTKFSSNTIKEIENISWVPLSELGTYLCPIYLELVDKILSHS